MQPSRTASALLCALPLLAVGLVAGWADDMTFQIDETKVSDLQGKAFKLKDSSSFMGTAPGFDKEFKTGKNDWTDRRADVGGRDVYAPDVKMDKAFTVPQTSLFQGTSSFSDKTAPFKMGDANLPMNAPMEHFNAQVPFADKAYTGPENDRLRQALAQLLDKKGQATGTPDPLHPVKDDGLRKQLNAAGGSITPVVTISDVKVLLNKDIAPIPEAAPPQATPASPAQGATVK